MEPEKTLQQIYLLFSILDSTVLRLSLEIDVKKNNIMFFCNLEQKKIKLKNARKKMSRIRNVMQLIDIKKLIREKNVYDSSHLK